VQEEGSSEMKIVIFISGSSLGIGEIGVSLKRKNSKREAV